jgi:glucose-6-phosphate isomerase
VGGRFSALTPVGLFPALCAGISGRKLLGGAASVRDTFVAEAAEKNAALLFAGLHHAHYAEHERRVTVLMPYAASLRELALWFRQLWAESLGKAKTRGGKVMPVGFTPVAALGPADQHSQLQLWNEGPDDAVITLLTVDKSRFDPVMPRFHVDLAPPRLLARKRMSVLLRAEIEATAQTLASHGRPNGTLAIGRVTPETVGGLMMFFMLATAATAELLDIDAYGQPGVEEDKRLIRESLRDS